MATDAGTSSGDGDGAPLAAGRPGRPGRRRLPAPVVVAVAFGAGAVPFTGLAARLVAGVDLRRVGNGTVSGTGLFAVAGFGPLALAGSLDVAKGAVGPWLAGGDRPVVQALAAGAAVCGHNWSPFLGGAGGRGVATALGALGVSAPEGAVTLALGLGVGRLVRQTGLAVAAATVALPVVLGWRRRGRGAALGAAVAVPMLAKRVAGNRRLPVGAGWRGTAHRLLFDRDPARPRPGPTATRPDRDPARPSPGRRPASGDGGGPPVG